MKDIYAKELQDRVGEEIAGLFILEALNDFSNAKGTKWAECVFSDCTGKIRGRLWSDSMDEKYRAYVGRIVKVIGKITLYEGMALLTTCSLPDAIQLVPEDEYQLEDFIKQMDESSFSKACECIRYYINSISTPVLKCVLIMAFTDKMLNRMRSLPAGIQFHHAYNGGLLEHTLEVTQITEILCGLYFKDDQKLEKDLAITGALLHDLGKIKEYTPFPMSQRTINSSLTGFVNEGTALVEKLWTKVLAANPNVVVDPEILLHLKHIVLTCHATAGVQKPKTKEALIVSHADEASAGINGYDTAIMKYDEEHPGNLDKDIYSKYHNYYLYRKDGGSK